MLFVSRFIPGFGIIPKLPIVYINVEVEAQMNQFLFRCCRCSCELSSLYMNEFKSQINPSLCMRSLRQPQKLTFGMYLPMCQIFGAVFFLQASVQYMLFVSRFNPGFRIIPELPIVYINDEVEAQMNQFLFRCCRCSCELKFLPQVSYCMYLPMCHILGATILLQASLYYVICIVVHARFWNISKVAYSLH